MKKTFICILLVLAVCGHAKAQSNARFKNQHLIFNCDLASGNLYTMAASSVVTGLANYYLLNDAFFENSFAYSFYSTDIEHLKVKTMNPMGMTASELFNNLQVGLKIGYQTYRPEFFNCGIYASAHYKLEQFEAGRNDENMQKHRSQSALLGVTGLLSLGSMEQASRVIVEAGLRYGIPLAYRSPWGSGKDLANNGLSSHFSIKLASRGMWQNIGIYADICHANTWKKLRPGKKLDNWTLGITWTITPQQADDRKN